MAYALGSLDPSACIKLEEAESLLVDKSETYIYLLSQVLIKHGHLTEDEWTNMVNISCRRWCYLLLRTWCL